MLKLKWKFAKIKSLQFIVYVDFSSIWIGNESKCFLREIKGCSTTRRTVINYLNHNTTPTRLCDPFAISSSASNSIVSSTSCPVIPYYVTRSSYQRQRPIDSDANASICWFMTRRDFIYVRWVFRLKSCMLQACSFHRLQISWKLSCMLIGWLHF